MTRSTFQFCILGVFIVVTGVISLYRYSTERGRFHHLETVVLTGDVHTARLDPVTDTRLDVNRASHAELAALPGVSSNIAAAIIDYRHEHPFTHVAELIRIHGIGDKRMVTLTEYLRCVPVDETANDGNK